MIPTSYLESDLIGMIADVPSQARWGAVTFYCSTTPLGIEQNLIMAGDMEETFLQCIFPISAIAGQPPLDNDARIGIQVITAITFSNYRIKHVDTSQDGVSYSLTLATDKRA